MHIHFFSLYAEKIDNFINRGIIGRTIESKQVEITSQSLRDFAPLPHRKVDDYPFSNRKGMLLKYDVLKSALDSVGSDVHFIMPDPSGKLFNHTDAKALSQKNKLCFISPAYEGVDARIFEQFKIDRFSVGDFILTNGDTPSVLMAEAIIRYLPGVLGCADCVEDDSILSGLLEAPQFCAPRSIDQMPVPDVLLSGHHQEIDRWKLKQSLRQT
ncbi:MAG: tRNA (guanosine(37)-N1)-methyltransferase TrmD, partial [Candidatus Margulisiibacteriota bacterium]|nr:tRNA (guanosine(37)-N1)-methyltransferase TrmD [Candidatus Margulisiibacteriota bacterium]